MTGTNHALAGAVIALAVKEPVLALPLALASHFALDVMPHFGMHYEDRLKYPKLFKVYLRTEAIALILIFISFWLLQVPLLVYFCSLLAMSPDFAWGYRYIFVEKKGSLKPPPMNSFNRWHAVIQTRESIKPGMYIEMAFAACLVAAIIGPLT